MNALALTRLDDGRDLLLQLEHLVLERLVPLPDAVGGGGAYAAWCGVLRRVFAWCVLLLHVLRSFARSLNATSQLCSQRNREN